MAPGVVPPKDSAGSRACVGIARNDKSNQFDFQRPGAARRDRVARPVAIELDDCPPLQGLIAAVPVNPGVLPHRARGRVHRRIRLVGLTPTRMTRVAQVLPSESLLVIGSQGDCPRRCCLGYVGGAGPCWCGERCSRPRRSVGWSSKCKLCHEQGGNATACECSASSVHELLPLFCMEVLRREDLVPRSMAARVTGGNCKRVH